MSNPTITTFADGPSPIAIFVRAQSMEEAQAAVAFLEARRNARPPAPREIEEGSTDWYQADLEGRIMKALNLAPLSEGQIIYLKGLMGEIEPIKIRDLGKKLGVPYKNLGAAAGKLSGRCMKVLTSAEKAKINKQNRPIHLMVTVTYEPGTNESIHELTTAGRAAVQQVLGL